MLTGRSLRGREVCGSYFEHRWLGSRDLVSPVGGHGRPERHVCPGREEGHCESSWLAVPFLLHISSAKWTDPLPPGMHKRLNMELSDQPFSSSFVGAVNATAIERI